VSTVAAQAGRQAVSRAFAETLSYPHGSPAPAARACAALLLGRPDEAAELVAAFAAFAEEASPGEIQETYTRAFDLDTMSRSEPTCYPYVGHYLFEESHKRGAFILGLRRRFRREGFEDGGELPDHLVVLLRFLDHTEDEQLADELVDDAILPALARMTLVAEVGGDEVEPGRAAYLGLLRALSLALSADRPGASDALEVELEREWLREGDSLGIDRDRPC